MQMGCSSSKVDNEEVVLLCKERKQFIKQAVNRRYDLAAAHVEYIHSLGSIGKALRQFAEGEVGLLASIQASSASPSTNSPEKKSVEHVSLPEKSSTTSSLHLHSDSHQSPPHSHSHSHSPSPSDENPSDSPIHFHDHSESPIHFHDHSESPIHFQDHSESPPSYASPFRMDYLRSTNTPSRSYEERPVSPDRVAWNSYSGDNQYGGDSFFGIPMGPAPSTSAPPPGPSYSPNHPPPPPSPPKNNTWEFFNPFITFGMDNAFPYYGGSRFSPGSEGSSRDSKHVREEEGIPDLEEEDQGIDEKNKVYKEKRVAENDQSSNKGSPDDVVETTSRSVMQSNPTESLEENLSSKGTEKGAGEKVDGKSGDILVDKEVLPNGDVNQENLAVFVTHGRRNILEVIKDIESEFQSAQNSGNEVAKLLETNRVPYRPKYSVLRALSARVLNAITWHRSRPSEASSSKRPNSSKAKKKVEEYINDPDEDCGMASGSHSSTLDKIYVWEKKLYEEVKAGEKIRIECLKKMMQLKHHNEKGDDRQLVEATKTAIKSLETKIKVAIQVVDQVSTRIHKLRDEELQPQIAELIHGFIKMWRVMFDCHQKQHKLISETKFLGHVGAKGMSSELHLKATMQLENELRNWHTCFSNWIHAQREYVKALNGWLLKCLLQKPEETDDGIVPFSPRRVGAPPVFIICNDWSQALEINMPERDVCSALERFREAVKRVLEHQDVEQRQKRKVETYEKDLKRKLVSVQKFENRLHEPQVSSDKKHGSETGQTSSILSDEKMSLDSFRKKVDLENAKQQEVMQEARKFTLNSLETCLKPVFEAVVEFSESSLKTYEDLSVHCSRENFSHMNGEISHVKNA